MDAHGRLIAHLAPSLYGRAFPLKSVLKYNSFHLLFFLSGGPWQPYELDDAYFLYTKLARMAHSVDFERAYALTQDLYDVADSVGWVDPWEMCTTAMNLASYIGDCDETHDPSYDESIAIIRKCVPEIKKPTGISNRVSG